MSLEDMDKTVDRLIRINDQRLRSLRTKTISDVDYGAYYALSCDHDWYWRVKNAIRMAIENPSVNMRDRLLSLLNEKVQDRMKSVEDEILDKARMNEQATPAPPEQVPKIMTEDDKVFLKSCGIEETLWPLS